MWRITLRDLQWRRRRFAIAVGGTAMVFALTLVLAGVSASFRTEANNTVTASHGDAWVVARGSSGPFTSFAVIPIESVEAIGRETGVSGAEPLVILHHTIHLDGFKDINLIGYRVDGFTRPQVRSGGRAQQSGDAVVDESLGLNIGETFTVAQDGFRVVGTVKGLTAYGGVPNVYVPLQDAQRVGFQGKPIATTVVTRGHPAELPANLALMDNDAARADIIRPLAKAITTIDLLQLLLWLVAATIIGSVVYLNAMERVRDFAILKATGAPARVLLVGLASQSVMISLLAALLSTGIALGLARLFPLPVEVPVSSLLLLPGIAVVVGLLASVAGARRALEVDPAVAFSA